MHLIMQMRSFRFRHLNEVAEHRTTENGKHDQNVGRMIRKFPQKFQLLLSVDCVGLRLAVN